MCMQDYKSLCAAVTICDILVVPKLDLYILTRDLQNTLNRGECAMGCTHVSCTYHVH